MANQTKRIALNVGWGYVPGLNAVITGAVLAAACQWDEGPMDRIPWSK